MRGDGEGGGEVMWRKAKEYWAQKNAENWTHPRLPEAEIDALSHAYLTGFNRAIEEAAGMMITLSPERGEGLAILIRAIGTARVDESGRRESEIQESEWA